MRLAASVLLLCSSILPGVLAQESDEQVTASYEQTGSCAYYFQKPAKRAPLSQTCIKYCENNGGHGYSECDRSPYKDIDFEHGFDKSLIEKDADGDLWVPCKCKCENKDVEGISEAIFDIVAEGLAQLDNIICAVMLESFKTILEVGIEFVPGGAALNGAKTAVQGAKSFVENGLEAADFFGNWVGKACGVPDWNFDLWSALIGAPDSYGTSIGCRRKNKSECKKPESKPDTTKKPDNPLVSTKKEEPKPTSTNKEEPKTTSTKKEEPKTTSTNKEEPKTTSTKKEEPKTTSTNKEEPKTTSTKKEEPKTTSTNKEESPRRPVPRKRSPRRPAPIKRSPRRPAPRKRSPRRPAPIKRSPRRPVPRKRTLPCLLPPAHQRPLHLPLRIAVDLRLEPSLRPHAKRQHHATSKGQITEEKTLC
ncbi:hypothetical protein K469DRAFT_211108 [Zopfia rhizophila CBS 207.26]|uniref:Uncharacterized protein n=1 Tax=Zopfia rhizophila CBS 207.26 TaxID=1314779 RepID=A0A6A6DZK8_9PEZI|nr:hypothetical protein K469DRAFT_211108 [Zopfia rhizophila CBS 207.26]